MYPPVPLLLVTAGAARFPSARVSTDLPADLQVETVIQVRRIGGPSPVLTLDDATVSIDVWASPSAPEAGDAESRAEAVAMDVRHWLLFELPGTTVNFTPLEIPGITGVATVARTRELSGPGRRPTADPDLRRVGLTYQITTHSH